MWLKRDGSPKKPPSVCQNAKDILHYSTSSGKSVVADMLLKGEVRVRFQKAFDSVEGEFLLKSLEAFNFGQDLLQKYTKLCYEQLTV